MQKLLCHYNIEVIFGDHSKCHLLISIELKLKWTKYYLLPAAGADNNDANSNDIIFIIKGTKLYVPVVTFAAINNQ